jgi:predicted dinucleotide-binding enzyme
MKAGILGSGDVGKALANGVLKFFTSLFASIKTKEHPQVIF